MLISLSFLYIMSITS